MKRALIILGSVCTALSVVAAVVLLRSGGGEDARFDRGLTRLVVSDLTESDVVLYRAGDRPGDTVRLGAIEDGSEWLEPGNYFLRGGRDGRSAFYPVPLTGYRCGPDEDGAYVVTIRPLPAIGPPDIPTLRESGAAPAGDGRYAYIPSGSFLIGDRQNPRERHYVWLTGFFIGRFEVTNGEFRAFLGADDGYRDDSNWTAQGRAWKTGTPPAVSALLEPGNPGYERFGRTDHPVTLVSWYEADAFCRWLTRRFAGRSWQFTLPTDAEWEKAARGPDNFDYGLSMTISDTEGGWYNWRKNPGVPVTVVGVDSTRRGFAPNRYGLYHVTGNVVEWTRSVDRAYNRDAPFADDDRNRPDTPGRRTARGGSWYSAAISYLSIPYRDAFQPEHRTQDVGFRVVAKILP